MVDAVDTLKTILTGDWNSANTDSITPTIDFIEDLKELDLDNTDYVLLVLVSTIHDSFNIGGTRFSRESTVTADIRTTNKNGTMASVREHIQKMKEEVIRIVKANLPNPDADWQLALLKDDRNFTNKHVGIGRMTVDVALKRWGA